MSILTYTVRRTSLQELEHHVASRTHCVGHNDRDVDVACVNLGNTTSDVTLVQVDLVDRITVLLGCCHDNAVVLLSANVLQCFRNILVASVHVTSLYTFIRTHQRNVVHDDESRFAFVFQFVLFQVRTQIVWCRRLHFHDHQGTFALTLVHNVCSNLFVSCQNFRLVNASYDGVVSFRDQVFRQLEREINPVVTHTVHVLCVVLHCNGLTTTGVSRPENEIAPVEATTENCIDIFPAS
ncbi:hypothetical protein D3C75_639390 [compost metagenome]